MAVGDVRIQFTGQAYWQDSYISTKLSCNIVELPMHLMNMIDIENEEEYGIQWHEVGFRGYTKARTNFVYVGTYFMPLCCCLVVIPLAFCFTVFLSNPAPLHGI